MDKMIGIVIGIVILGGILYAKNMEKSDRGFVIKDDTVHTYYMNRIIWGDNYLDHDNKTPVHNTEVVAFGDGWAYSTTTGDDGVFKVEVKPDVSFKIKASDGNKWIESAEQKSVPKGTVFDDRG